MAILMNARGFFRGGGGKLNKTSSSLTTATASKLQVVDLVTLSKQLVVQAANIQNAMWSLLNSDQGADGLEMPGASFF